MTTNQPNEGIILNGGTLQVGTLAVGQNSQATQTNVTVQGGGEAARGPGLSYLKLSIERAGGDYVGRLDLTTPDTSSTTTLADGVTFEIDPQALLARALDTSAYGQALSEQIFASPQLRMGWLRARAYADGAGGVMRFQVALDPDDEALHRLLWETLIDPDIGQPLALDERLLFARNLASASLAPIARPAQTDLRVTAAIAAPEDGASFNVGAVDVEAEVQRIREAFQHTLTRLVVRHPSATQQPPTLARICDGLREAPHALLLMCHGTMIDGSAYILLENERGRSAWVSGKQFVSSIAALAQRPVLVILASCRSAGSVGVDALQSLGPQLARLGIPAVVGFQGDVAQETVARLIGPFVRELLRDGVVDRALAAARSHLSGSEWWQPTLWLRVSDGCLWGRP